MTDRSPSAPSARGGRPRDASRDEAIVTAVLDVLAEHGYERMTMDQVARRAGAGKATLYRRWTSKAELVVHAVSQFARTPTLEELPDTGTLRDDLLALMRPQEHDDDRHALSVASGIASLLSVDPALADAAGAALVEPFVASQRLIMRRSIERGEVSGDVDVDTIAFVTPSMTAFRLIVQRKPVDVGLLALLIDTVVLPALGLTPSPGSVGSPVPPSPS